MKNRLPNLKKKWDYERFNEVRAKVKRSLRLCRTGETAVVDETFIDDETTHEMKVVYSKSFQKAYREQSGKIQKSIANTVREVKEAASVENLTDCTKLTGFKHAYRLRIGNLRAFFILRIEGTTAIFEYLVPRGEAYSKKMMDRLKSKDN